MSSSHTKFATTNKSNVDKYVGPITYPMSDIHSIYTHYNPKTGRNEPTPNTIIKEENNNEKN